MFFIFCFCSLDSNNSYTDHEESSYTTSMNAPELDDQCEMDKTWCGRNLLLI